nr:hypothetical protein [Oenococcus oeni]
MQPKLFFDMDNVLVDTLTVFDRLNPISYQVKNRIKYLVYIGDFHQLPAL